MIKKITKLFCSIGIITFFSLSCNTITESQDKPTQIAAVNFDDESELTNWNLGSYFGHTELD